jgi:hypothetical protein
VRALLSMIALRRLYLSNQGGTETERRVSALVDTASIVPLETRHRESDDEATGVLLRAAEEAAFAEAPFYAGRCCSWALANDVLKNSAHLADQCAHCSACVNYALVGFGQGGSSDGA